MAATNIGIGFETSSYTFLGTVLRGLGVAAKGGARCGRKAMER